MAMRQGVLMLLACSLALRATALSVAAAPATLTAQDVTIQLTQSEQAAGELSPMSCSTAGTILAKHGVVVLRRVAALEVVEDCAGFVSRSFDQCNAALDAKGLKPDDAFQFNEIVHRARRRYDMQLEAMPEPLPSDFLNKPGWLPLVRKVLGDDSYRQFTGAVISLPGASAQGVHMDGGHLFQNTHGWEQPQCPLHCLNVFLPLVDVTQESGPTEFWLGSHMIDSARESKKVLENPGTPLPAERGDCIVFDYRVLHRGMANEAAMRPVLYSTYARSWFRDAKNFPEEKLFATKNKNGFGGGGSGAKKPAAKKKSKKR